MRLNRKDYKEAEECLQNYNYNCKAIKTIPQDIITISSGLNIGTVRAPYSTSDSVFNTYVKLQEDDEFKKVVMQYNAVENAKLKLNQDCQDILEYAYIKRIGKWNVINKLHLSERTYARRKRTLIYTVHNEIKKLAQKWHN